MGVKSRICARTFNMVKKPKDSLYAPTPGANVLRILLVMAAAKKWTVKFFDISRAFLHTPCKEKVYLRAPPEYRDWYIEQFGIDPGDVAWLMNVTIYGLYEAMRDFDDHFSEVATEKAELKRLTSEPSAYTKEEGGETSMVLSLHVDDGIVIGNDDKIDGTLKSLGEHFLLKITGELRTGQSQLHLGRVITRTMLGFTIKVARRTFESLLKHMGLSSCRPVATPGIKSEQRVKKEEPVEDSARAVHIRTGIGKLLFVSGERPDIQFSTKEVSRACLPQPREMRSG